MSNFAEHAAVAAKEYELILPRAAKLVDELQRLLGDWTKGMSIQAIQGRAKTIASFTEKASKPSKTHPDRPRYPNPLADITDLAGIRVITYFPDAITAVERVLGRELEIIERIDKSRQFDESGKLGYQSVHFLVRLKEPRSTLHENIAYADIVAEIQVRTILQHAWAEMEHDIQYKSADEIPTEIRRRFAALAGLIEIADREFQAIQDADASLRRELEASLAAENMPPPSPEPDARSWPDLISRYDELIQRHPAQYTHYLGRAKARFLSGDRTGALMDLEAAESVAPGQPRIALARRNIELGLVNADAYSFREGRRLIDRGMAELSKGSVDAAVSSIEAALPLLQGGIYASFDYAIALCAAHRFAEARSALSLVTPIEGAFIRVNVEACRAIIETMETRTLANLEVLDHALEALSSPFILAFSPLRHFKKGIAEVGGGNDALLAPIFSRLE